MKVPSTYDLVLANRALATAFDTVSDIRLKTNVKDMNVKNITDNFMKYRFKTFEMKRSNKMSNGLIAQQLQNVDSNLVQEFYDQQDKCYYKTVNYDQIYNQACFILQNLINRVGYLEFQINQLTKKLI